MAVHFLTLSRSSGQYIPPCIPRRINKVEKCPKIEESIHDASKTNFSEQMKHHYMAVCPSLISVLSKFLQTKRVTLMESH
jgi:hypothetical protein